MSLPTPERLAHHEAGHAVVQHWISEGRFHVVRVALDSDGEKVAGSSLIDQDVALGLYHFGLVMLAGIAAENRYVSDRPAPQEREWGAVGDVNDWLAAARELLKSEARVGIVTGSVMRRLGEFFRDQTAWGVVTELTQALLAEGSVEGERLQAILRSLRSAPGKPHSLQREGDR